MKKKLLAFALTFTVFASEAQEKVATPTNKLFYVEVGGPGQIFSMNFDGRFKKGERLGLGYRVGLGFTVAEERIVTTMPGPWGPSVSWEYRTRSVGTLPLGINYLFGKPGNPNIFEVGLGATLLTRKTDLWQYNYDPTQRGNVLGHATFMYRRQPVNGGFSWRIGATPIIGVTGDIHPFGAIGLGYSF